MSDDQAASDVEALVGFLRDRDAWCPACRYNLRGLTSPRCPECGRELRLSVGAIEPFLRAWITLVVAACSAAGVGVLFGWLVIAHGFPRRYGPKETILRVVIAFFMMMVVVAPGVLVARRRFLKLSKRAQWRIARAVMTVTVAAFLLMLATIT